MSSLRRGVARGELPARWARAIEWDLVGGQERRVADVGVEHTQAERDERHAGVRQLDSEQTGSDNLATAVG
jgi:hypothetical protein